MVNQCVYHPYESPREEKLKVEAHAATTEPSAVLQSREICAISHTIALMLPFKVGAALQIQHILLGSWT